MRNTKAISLNDDPGAVVVRGSLAGAQSTER